MEKNKRILGLDVGSKSCGIAISDPLGIIAQGKENFSFEEFDWETLIKHLKKNYLKEVKLVVVGLPLLPSGDKSQTTLMIEEFVWKFKEETQIEVAYEEEEKTTKQAHQIMIEAGLSRKKRKNYKDKIAATIILQNYIDRVKNGIR